MKVEEIISNRTTLEDLELYISDLAGVVRDKEPKNAKKLFERLLTESVGYKASRVLEFLPCVIYMSILTHHSQYFGFMKGRKYYTNARELLNWGWSLEQVLKVVDFKHYKAFKIEAPYFIYGQISTHTQLTTVSHSQRYAECDRGYWKPNEVDTISQFEWNENILNWSSIELKNVMKNHQITRKEVFDRGHDMLQNRVFVIGGYTNNSNAWEHFIKQRTDKLTQLETRDLVKNGLKPFFKDCEWV